MRLWQLSQTSQPSRNLWYSPMDSHWQPPLSAVNFCSEVAVVMISLSFDLLRFPRLKYAPLSRRCQDKYRPLARKS